MKVQAIKTGIMYPPQDDLLALIKKAIPIIEEKSILVITSKVVAIHQGRCIPLDQAAKDDLAKKEADWYLDRGLSPYGFMLTVKYSAFLASAGIDQSNANGFWVLLPSDPDETAKQLWSQLRDHYGLQELGIVIVDSHIQPLRRGAIGVSIGTYGFNPIRDYRGKPDIFGRTLQVASTNMADSLATAAVLEMGEADETTPLAVITGITNIMFGESFTAIDDRTFKVSMEEDVYAPIFQEVKWEKGGGGK